MKRKLFLLTGLIILGFFSITIFGQKAVAFEIENSGEYYGGRLVITVNGKRKMIAEQANDAWIINDGKEIAYSGRDGAGGYENEGQSLRIYDISTGKTKKIMSQYYYVTGLSAFKLKNGQTALLVRLEDGGLGGAYFSVVDPQRGEVFFRSWAEITQLKNDTITHTVYKYFECETNNQDRDTSFHLNKNAFPAEKPKVKPYKTETHDLKKILQNKVIYNKPTMEYLDAGLKYVKLY